MKESKGYHGANQPVPSIDPELLDNSNAKLSEISKRWGDYSEVTPEQIEQGQKKVKKPDNSPERNAINARIAANKKKALKPKKK